MLKMTEKRKRLHELRMTFLRLGDGRLPYIEDPRTATKELIRKEAISEIPLLAQVWAEEMLSGGREMVAKFINEDNRKKKQAIARKIANLPAIGGE